MAICRTTLLTHTRPTSTHHTATHMPHTHTYARPPHTHTFTRTLSLAWTHSRAHARTHTHTHTCTHTTPTASDAERSKKFLEEFVRTDESSQDAPDRNSYKTQLVRRTPPSNRFRFCPPYAPLPCRPSFRCSAEKQLLSKDSSLLSRTSALSNG